MDSLHIPKETALAHIVYAIEKLFTNEDVFIQVTFEDPSSTTAMDIKGKPTDIKAILSVLPYRVVYLYCFCSYYSESYRLYNINDKPIDINDNYRVMDDLVQYIPATSELLQSTADTIASQPWCIAIDPNNAWIAVKYDSRDAAYRFLENLR